MLDNTALQPVGALCFLYAGIVTGAGYGLASLFGRRFSSRPARNLLDALFVLFMGAVFALALLLVTGGALRGYAFLMTALGFLLERCTLHRLFLDICSKRIHKSGVN